MPAASAPAIELSAEDRVVLERWTRAYRTPQSVARRARVILLEAPWMIVGDSHLGLWA